MAQYELVKLLGAQLAGFYDPDEDRMYLAADLGEAERLATLAHELVHALQDQHYQLGRRLKYREGASDQQAALHALAAGQNVRLDAVLHETLWSYHEWACTEHYDVPPSLVIPGILEDYDLPELAAAVGGSPSRARVLWVDPIAATGDKASVEAVTRALAEAGAAASVVPAEARGDWATVLNPP